MTINKEVVILLRQFSKYFTVGVVNTLIHWAVFALVLYFFEVTQALTNVCAFLVAVTFSFFMNAKYTFKQKASRNRYIAFVGFMGMLSYANGYVSDLFNFYPIVTLVSFSALSLVLGFLYSHYFVFKEDKE